MLKGKCALITGSTAGLGYAIAQRLAAQGCNIVLNGLGDANEIEAKRAALEGGHGVKAIYHGADLANPDAITDLVATAVASFGAVDVLVNNAVVRHFSPVEDFPVEKWDHALAVNLSSAFHTIRLALPTMRKRGWGRIINMSSVYGLFGTVNRVDYVTTKTALIGMTRAIALETLNQDITCNAICPGTALTAHAENLVQSLMTAEDLTRDTAVKRFLSTRQPAGRFVGPDGVAGLVVFLCGEDSGDITGSAISIDGGWAAS